MTESKLYLCADAAEHGKCSEKPFRGIDFCTSPEEANSLYHPAYRFHTSWALRRSALAVRAPSLTKYQAYWIADGYASNRDVWVDSIEQFLLNLNDHAKTVGLELETPNRQEEGHDGRPIKTLYLLHNKYAEVGDSRYAQPIGEYPNRYQTVRFSMLWHSLPISLSFELHSEFFSLSAVIDLTRKRDPARKNLKSQYTDTPDSVVRALESLNSFAVKRFSAADWANPNFEAEEALRDDYETIYHLTWSQFYREVLHAAFEQSGGTARLGSIFADFRGLVVCRCSTPDRFMTEAENGHPSEQDTEGELCGGNGLRAALSILPFMRADRRFRLGDLEYTFSRFLEGRCLYATALGAQPPELQAKDELPVTYLMVIVPASADQIGRLVDTIHTLGTVRLAALYDLQLIVDAGARLREHESALERITKQLPSTLSSTEIDRDIAIKNLTAMLFRCARDLSETGNTIQNGLAYRVEQARYYRQQFNEGVELLRIGDRIEGFQPYDQFVHRRLGGTYDTINMVGLRYERVRHEIRDISERLQTAEGVRAAEQSVALQASIEAQTEQSNQIQRDVTALLQIVATLLRIAERTTWLVFFPYYFSGTLLDFFGHETPLRYIIVPSALILGVGACFREALGGWWRPIIAFLKIGLTCRSPANDWRCYERWA